MNALWTKWCIIILVSLFNVAQVNVAQYVPPNVRVEPLYPVGIRMSIPHESGITLVAFHVKFNQDFQGLEAGTIARDIVKVRGGRWTYEDRSTRLKQGDVIYYWIHVIYNGLGYNLLDQQHVVREMYHYDGTRVTGQSSGTCNTKVSYYDKNTHNLKQHSVCSGQLIFEETFDSFNASRWTIVERFADSPNDEFVMYMNSDKNVEVNNGELHIKPVLTESKFGLEFVRSGILNLDKCTGVAGTAECKRNAIGSQILPPVMSGRLNTKQSFNFLYGKVEIRAKLPRGDWIYPLISLESTEPRSEDKKFYCDILVAHSVGNPTLTTHNDEDISGRVLLGGAFAINLDQHLLQDNRMDLPMKTSSSLWSDDYHVYELEWKSGSVSVKVDGEQYGQQQVTYDVPVYLNMGLAVGGHILFPDNSTSGNYDKPWRNVASKALYNFYIKKDKWLESWTGSDTGLHIDYIKVWSI
ncbi:beta-1,3-glucan-binding protein 2-like [Hylaeus anthracinus]|uniref:beta-1,3-glucan-binding protein 2-like n=1 Tax=Hylaeus anthracinus TaxID=313031 RepID=UPI0023B9A43A|nr:beta-1,3-glucan-binding protein 2-like [Hylaeus anthracinus]